MIRRAEQTVRWPVVRGAPMARSWALVQTRSENNGAKVARMATISGGRSTGVISRPTVCVPSSILVKDPRGLPANLAKVEKQRQAQDAVRLEPKRYVVRYRGCRLPCRGWRTTGRKARPHPGAIEEVNEVTPLPPHEGRRTAKDADEAAEEG